MSNFFPPNNHGWIETITGCMFSGKTEELIRQVRRAHLAKKKFKIYKPALDQRYAKDLIVSHSQQKLTSTTVENPQDILKCLDSQPDLVAIDEVQFFSEEIISVCEVLASSGVRVIVAGLDTDWMGRPFHPVPQLLAISELVHKLYAICGVCGQFATRTQRLVSSNKNILLGSGEIYQARCREHFELQQPTHQSLGEIHNAQPAEV